jgi:DNA-binding transcriptional ArsR family regulator
MTQPIASLLKELAHPVRAAILARLVERPSSPAEMAADLGVKLGLVDYHTRRLEAAGLAKVIKRQRPKGRRGHPQTYYGADPLYIRDKEWMTLPELLREALIDAGLRELASRADVSRMHTQELPAGGPSAEAALALVRNELVALLGEVAGSLLRVVRRTETVTQSPEAA